MEARLGGGQYWGVVCLDIQSVVLGLVLGGRDVVECFVESLIVVEADEVEDLVFGLFEAREAAPVDELVLERRDPGLGERVVGV